MLKSAIRDDDPVIFLEQERMYGNKGEVPDDPDFTVPLGVAAEISGEIMERAFDYLDAPVKRVSGADAPMPYARNLERLALPDVEKIVAAVREVSYLD